MTNLKLVLRTYSALRQMSPDDIALLETLRALNDGDRELMVETLQGKAMGRKAATKTRTYQRCEQCGKTKGHAFHKDSSNDGYHVFQGSPSSSKLSQSQSSSKSPRASGMATVLKSRVSQQREIARDDSQHCIAQIDDNGGLMECGKPADDNIHHLSTHPDYHPFDVPPHVRPAPVPSSANGAVVGGSESTSAASGD